MTSVGWQRFFFLMWALVFASFPALSPADPDNEDSLYKFDPSSSRNWKEAAVVIPPYPEERNLLRVPGSAADTVEVFLDRASVTIGDDGVVRLAYVVEASGGGRNVFYEGFRCSLRQYKTYAYGVQGSKFSPMPAPAWQDVRSLSRNAVRWNLSVNILCDQSLIAPQHVNEIFARIETLGEEP
jgi:hypothetical protein